MSTPAGWYDDGSGRRRWWNGQQWTGNFQVVQVKPAVPSSHLWWALSPIYSCALIAFIPALHAAIKLQRRDLWYWAVGLILGNVFVWILIGSSPSNAEGKSTPIQTVGVTIALVLAVLGTIQAFRTRDEVFGRSQTAVPNSGANVPSSLDTAIATSLDARKLRVKSVAIAVDDPSLARDLKMGRPDLVRQYDDGGLVDVNHVPEAVLVSHLGLSQDQARTVIAARDHIGAFVNIDDLCVAANLPPQILDTVRDRVVTL